MWLDHANTSSAEYAIVPNVTSAGMAAWAASRPLSILANNENVSAVRDLRNGNLGITFWRAAVIDGIQSSAAAVVYVTGDDQTMRVSAADPNANASGSFTLTFPGQWTTSDVPSSRTARSTTVTIPRSAGQTTTIALMRLPLKRRSVRR